MIHFSIVGQSQQQQLSRFGVIFCGQDLSIQYFSRINPDHSLRKSLSQEILAI
jgi:hypothetical protein